MHLSTSTWTQIWQEVSSTAHQRAVTALVVVLIALFLRPIWRISRLAVTFVHEGGHAVAVLVSGGHVGAILLRADTSGVTWHQGVHGRLRRALTSASGYPAPAAVGLGGAALTSVGDARVWLGALAAGAIILGVLWIRNFLGYLVTAAVAGGLIWLLTSGPRQGVQLAAAVCAWFLMLGGLRATFEAYGSSSRHGRGGNSDSDHLAQAAWLPATIWRAMFVIFSGAACGLGAWLLLSATSAT